MNSSASTRYFPNTGDIHRRTPRKQVLSALQDVVEMRHGRGNGIYTGTVSVALLLMALSEFYADVELENRDEAKGPVGKFPISVWLTAYLEEIGDNMKKYEPPNPDDCGVGNSILAALAVGAALTKDAAMAMSLCQYEKEALHEEASNDWLYGRAGYLYLLRLARASFQRVRDPDTGEYVEEIQVDKEARRAINKTIDHVLKKTLNAKRPWKWHGKHYLGAAHGDAGIITQVILTEPDILTDPDFFGDADRGGGDYGKKLEADLGVLLSYQNEDGNWPSSTPGGKDNLVQFCHGAPGIVSSLQSIRPHFSYDREMVDRIDEAIHKGQRLVWEKGLLTKEPCLCHGISGNAMVLPLEQFETFLAYTTRSEIEGLTKEGIYERTSERKASSLYCGAAGRAWAWAVADQLEMAGEELKKRGELSGRYLDQRLLGYNDI